jgi:hypothetical protein
VDQYANDEISNDNSTYTGAVIFVTITQRGKWEVHISRGMQVNRRARELCQPYSAGEMIRLNVCLEDGDNGRVRLLRDGR